MDKSDTNNGMAGESKLNCNNRKIPFVYSKKYWLAILLLATCGVIVGFIANYLHPLEITFLTEVMFISCMLSLPTISSCYPWVIEDVNDQHISLFMPRVWLLIMTLVNLSIITMIAIHYLH